MTVKNDASVFHSAIEDPKNNVLTSDAIDTNLLKACVHWNKNEVPGEWFPETNKHPPTNEVMIVVPPSLRY